MRPDGLAGTVVADMEYPTRVAYVLLSQLLAQCADQVGCCCSDINVSLL